MKKSFILIFILLLCGCGSNTNKYEDFKHYDLTNHSYKEFFYIRDDEIKEEIYAIGVLSKKDEQPEGYDEGLFYKVNDNDYILLHSYPGKKEIIDNPSYYRMYRDKIYVVENFGIIYEFTLNKENSKMRQLNFNIDNLYNYDETLTHYAGGHKIYKVTDEFIYFENVYISNTDVEKLKIKCSLENLMCVKEDN